MVNPEFVNAERPPYDFHLRTRSPAIGAGIPLSAVTEGFDGNPRPQNGAPSVGAFEPTRPVHRSGETSR
jgi:hypothetical protein